MGAPEMIAAIHELESYGLVFTAADDNELEEAIDALALASDEEGGE